MRSQLGRARGLGAGHSGVGHWWAERVTAASLLPLSTWFVVQMFRLGGADHADQTDALGGSLVVSSAKTFEDSKLSCQYSEHSGSFTSSRKTRRVEVLFILSNVT